MTKTAATYLAAAADAFEAGFASEAARKRALGDLNTSFDKLRHNLMGAIIAARTAENEEANHADYWAVPSYLHHVRPAHLATAAKYGDHFATVADMIALRDAIKAAPVAPVPVKPEAEVKAEAVRRSIVEEMERRKAMFVEGLDLGRVFAELFPRKNKAGEIIPSASLPVSVNAHWVHGHKGAVFVRHFFYLNGKLTPLNTIMAVAQTLDAEAGV